MAEHRLKCHAESFDAVVAGLKPFEIRPDDRDYRVGDRLCLYRADEDGRATVPATEIVKTVQYILRGGKFGLLHGYVIMGFPREISVDELPDDIIREAYVERFGDHERGIERVYGLLAEGEINLAMEEMARTFDLASPDHEKGIASMIARGRAREAQGVLL
jgi:hypothetical protein